jgi:excisionase family DNA binding protein
MHKVDQYYTVEEVAELLKVDPRTIRARISEGKLKASKIGRNFRIAESDLKIFLT